MVGLAANCAMDPTTGDPAATILNKGDVVIFAHTSHGGNTVTTGLFEAYFDGIRRQWEPLRRMDIQQQPCFRARRASPGQRHVREHFH